VTKPEDLDVLQVIAERSLEGGTLSIQALMDAHIDVAAVRNLELEGLIAIIDEGGDPTLELTDAGLAVLRPRNSS
jgi:hypothetical protein